MARDFLGETIFKLHPVLVTIARAALYCALHRSIFVTESALGTQTITVKPDLARGKMSEVAPPAKGSKHFLVHCVKQLDLSSFMLHAGEKSSLVLLSANLCVTSSVITLFFAVFFLLLLHKNGVEDVANGFMQLVKYSFLS